MLKQFRLAHERLLSHETLSVPQEYIPTEALEFYDDFGQFLHPRTGATVTRPTEYQIEEWNNEQKYKLIVKSQKVGISSWELRHDFNLALTKYKGKDILIIAQTQYHANEHLLTLKTDIINSPKYSKYLIRDPSEFLFREQKTKVREVQIKNPSNPLKPSRIIALGASEGAVWSWKNVAHIHMSDIAANDLKDDSPLFAAAFSRLANTGGSMTIETPPRGPHGRIFEIYQQSLLSSSPTSGYEIPIEGRFKIFHVTAQDGVRARLITQEFLDEEKFRLGALYPQYYEAEFISVSGNLFNQSAIDRCIEKCNPLLLREYTEKYMAVDLGFASSKFAIIIAEHEPKLKSERFPLGKIRIIKSEEISHPTQPQMMDRIIGYLEEYKNIKNIGVDATNREEFAMELKERIRERPSDWLSIRKKMAEYKAMNWDINKGMRVVPILFNLESKNRMASHARQLIEDERQLLSIDPRHHELIVFLRSAVFDDRGQLDKKLTPHDDIGDAFLMLMSFFKIQRGEKRE